MLKKALTKSGQRILKAIKKLSTKTGKRSATKKSSQTTSVSKVSLGQSSWRSAVPDHEAVSLSWSLGSLDTKSVDTYLTLVSENQLLDNPEECGINDGEKCCCCCAEYEENQRNENKENEMFV